MLQFYASENKVHQIRVCINSREYDIDEQDGNGWTALHYAAFAGRASIQSLALLIELGADLDLKNKTGDVALHIAAREANMDSVRKLLRAGAALEIENVRNITPMDMLKHAWRDLRADIDEGMVAREEIARKKREALERLAMERKLQEAQGQGDKKVMKKELSAENKRQKYMELREKLLVKMKISKTSHIKGMHVVEQGLHDLRLANKKEAALKKQHEEGWRGLSQGEAAVQASAAVAELEAAKAKGAEDDEMEARKELIAAEAECQLLRDRYSAADDEIQEVARRVDFCLNKEAQLTRLLPLARLLSVAMRVQQERERTGWVPKEDSVQESAVSVSVHTPIEEEPEPGPLTLCVRCNKEYHADPINNKHYSCRFHIGERVVTENWAVAWSCCRRSTEGCRTAPHISQEENDAIMRSFLPPPMAPAYPPPMRFEDR